MVGLRADVHLLGRTDARVLITGESGVGKEVLARAVHACSLRSKLPIVTINCASVAESLLESELFGHVKGSFTGAVENRTGLLEAADRGTVFLDEIGEMSLRMQALLLRFLENGEIQRVGSLLPRQQVDVRVIAATNRPLLKGLDEGWFREDLYYRLNVVHLKIPPLRERREDIAPLMEHFLVTMARRHNVPPPQLPEGVVQVLLNYEWPGNVRQLRNVIETLVVRRAGQDVALGDLPTRILEAQAPPASAAAGPAERTNATILFDRMIQTGESFWSVVHAPFLSRDLTRETVRAIVARGLWQTRGNYRILVRLFNMREHDYRRFLTFLRKYDLHQPVHAFRTAKLPATPYIEGGASTLVPGGHTKTRPA
jgi:transcriptional regulator with PAS, ATPase and Fis domain